MGVGGLGDIQGVSQGYTLSVSPLYPVYTGDIDRQIA